jgi:hypothetical protein
MSIPRPFLAAAVAAIAILTLPAAASAASGPGAPRTPVPGVNNLVSVTCPTTKACVTVGNDNNLNGKSAVINAATGAVKAWSGDLASASLNAVACPGSTSCVTVADDKVASLKVSTGAMKQTAKPKAPAGGIVAMSAVACAGTTKCYAVGFEGPNFSSTNAVVITLSPAGKLLADKKNTGTGMGAIACPSSSLCLASDASHSGVSIQLLKDGKPGTSKPLPANTYVEAISCFKASLCYALGGNSKLSPSPIDELFPLNPKNGTIGTMATIGGGFSGGTGVNVISCISATTCLVAGYTGSGSTAKDAVVAVVNGKPGAPAHYKGTNFPFDSVGCASTSRCYAVGSSSTGAVVVKVKS